jgi:ubiquinone/menaquinone biosynthesis C-methylase UbiE
MGGKYITYILRKLKLLHSADYIVYLVKKATNRRANLDFKLNNQNVKLPPDYLMYESFQLDYKKFYKDSLDTANWLTNHLKKHSALKNKKILDWGCGPGRIIRHLPTIIDNDCEFFGSDINMASIEWCRQNIEKCSFVNNSMDAKLPYEDNYFDIIFGISIFTHLSEKMHFDWFRELHRILRPHGIMLFTTQGNNFKVKLTKIELEQFSKGELVIRGNVKEGHRIFSAFQPSEFMLNLFRNVKILEHISSTPEKGKQLPQDIWIIKKEPYTIA